MKINPHATTMPFIVMVDPEECPTIESFDVRKVDQYNYFVIGGSHSTKARRQLVREHPTTRCREENRPQAQSVHSA